jgi:uncharacterized membrane protein
MSGPHAAGKGDHRRPCRTSKAEATLRDELFRGIITPEQFNDKYRELLKAGQIMRDGRVLRE